MSEPAATPIQTADVRGFLHQPGGVPWAGMVLTHGAGSNCQAPLLVKAASELCAAGILVLRCDLAFRQHRASGPPPRGSGPADRAGLRAAAAVLRDRRPGKLLLAGHSYGGRQASMLAAEAPGLADGLLLLSYPLHPPKKPDQPRTEHFPRLTTPALFVHGTTDPFGTLDELRAATAAIPAPTAIVAIERKGHDLGGGRLELGPVVAAVLERFGPSR